MADDLEQLVALCIAARPLERPPLPAAAAAQAAVADPVGDLLALVVLQNRELAAQGFARRSEQLLEHARHAKQLKRTHQQQQQQHHDHAVARHQLSLVSALNPGLAKALGIVSCQEDSNSMIVAEVKLKLAFSNKITGKANSSRALSQEHYTHHVAETVLRQQAAAVQSAIAPERSQPPSDVPRTLRSVFCLSCQWDETSQKLRPMLTNLPKGCRQSGAQTGTQVMVISGSTHVARLVESQPRPSIEIESKPWHARSLRLQLQSADFLLEAVLRSLPLDLLDQDKMRTVLANHAIALFGIAVDRASANTLACRWLCDYVYNTLKLKRLFVHSEPCSLHGLALV